VAVHLAPPAGAYHDSNCGWSETPRVAALGDFDGDGFDDFMLTDSPYTAVSEPFSANVYLFYGRAGRLASGDASREADARLAIDKVTSLVALGDIDADGLGDVAFAAEHSRESPVEYQWLSGRAARFSGALALDALTAPFLRPVSVGDLDGDGVHDVLLNDPSGVPHLFYGAPGLFAGGVDLSVAAATFEASTTATPLLIAGSDLDGDGDDELISTKVLSEQQFSRYEPRALALASGSSHRIEGQVPPPDPGNPYWANGRALLERVIPVGDLDGDGAGELLTQSRGYDEAADGPLEIDGVRYTPNDAMLRLNLHYGTPGGVSQTPR
jgi:hypothetical protein